MKEQEKAEEMFQYAVKLHGSIKAKEESIKSAEAISSLVPYTGSKMKASSYKSYWEKVVEYLKKK
jgi:hypothetical protein